MSLVVVFLIVGIAVTAFGLVSLSWWKEMEQLLSLAIVSVGGIIVVATLALSFVLDHITVQIK